MLKGEREVSGKFNFRICSILEKFTENFHGLGKVNDCQIKLYTNLTGKPIDVPLRPITYHLKAGVDNFIESMIKESVIEEHPPNKSGPWVSCAVIVPKSGSSLPITLDARNLKKALLFDNYPTPHQEDIGAQSPGRNFFSKLDFKSAFWQIEVNTEPRALTVFHANNKPCRYTRLIMGVEPAQSELNAAFKPSFRDIPNVYLIHNNLIIATKNIEEHLKAIREVMESSNEKILPLTQETVLLAQRK